MDCFIFRCWINWEIKDFILKLGETLDETEYDHPSDGVWIAKDAAVFPSAYIGSPCIIDHGAEIRQCAFIRGSAIVGKNAVVGSNPEEVENKDNWGITVIGDNIKIGDNVKVPPKSMIDKDMEGEK